MTAPITAARTGGLSFRLFGIPVTIHVSFLLIVALLGLNAGSLDRVGVWVGVATVAVLLHELGHGLVGRAAGLRPRIDLAGFGGVTSWIGPRDQLGRGWSLAISLAGPGLGFLGGGVALLLGAPCCTVPVTGGLWHMAAAVWLFACFGWGFLNLLPILPLDGGQALREVLPGSPPVRRRRAAVVGVVVGAALTLWALLAGQVFLTLLAGWITWSNVQQVGTARRNAPAVAHADAATEAARAGDAAGAVAHARAMLAEGASPRARQVATFLLARGLLDLGDDAEAYRAVADPRRTVPLPTDLVAEALARHPDRRTVDTAVRGWAAGAAGPRSRGLAAMVLAAHGHHDEVATLVGGAVADHGPSVEPSVGIALQTSAHVDGAFAAAAATGRGLLEQGGLRSPVLAYNTACSLARAGDAEGAVAMLGHALRLGFADLELLRGDDDLAALHDHPSWPALGAGTPPQ